MQDLMTSLVKSIQELFRYVYPGFLFLALLKLTGIEGPYLGTDILGSSSQLWSTIVIAILLAFVIYTIHRFFIHEYILLALFMFGVTAPGYKCKEHGNIPKILKWVLFLSMVFVVLNVILKYIKIKIGGFEIYYLLIPSLIINVVVIILFIYKSNYLNYYKKFVIRRANTENGFSRYMYNRWGHVHAIGITFWLPMMVYKYGIEFGCENGLIFRFKNEFWIAIVILLFVWVWQLISLSYVERGFFAGE